MHGGVCTFWVLQFFLHSLSRSSTCSGTQRFRRHCKQLLTFAKTSIDMGVFAFLHENRGLRWPGEIPAVILFCCIALLKGILFCRRKCASMKTGLSSSKPKSEGDSFCHLGFCTSLSRTVPEKSFPTMFHKFLFFAGMRWLTSISRECDERHQCLPMLDEFLGVWLS